MEDYRLQTHRLLPVLIALLFAIPGLCFGQNAGDPPGQDGNEPAAARAQPQPLPPLVAQHCSACHLPPRPGAMRRSSWPASIDEMVDFMKERQLLAPATQIAEIARFYDANSPESFPPIPDDLEPANLPFEKIGAGNPPKHERPHVTNLNVTDLDRNGLEDFLVTDNQNGTVSWVQFDRETGKWPEVVLASVPAPVRTSVFDFEGDGDLDIGVAAMGYMHPNDELTGEAHLLLNRGDQTFEQIGLIRNVARITDVRPGDFDNDGDTDFVIAMFGWRKTGGLAHLEQIDPKNFRIRQILQMNGPTHLYETDLNGDGNLDFLALITQEHEIIAGFLNDGGGNFANKILARANHPAFGSSGIHPVDLDGDGDLDILYTNGDMMDDDPVPKPYQGVRWFENQGGRYQLHHLAAMPGCYCAVAHDMDGDGDLDVVVSSLYFHWDEHDFPSLIWLENDGKQNFTRRRIAYDPTNLASIGVGDLNGDGIPDIVGGGMHVPGPIGRMGRITVWLGQKKAAKSAVR